MSDHLRQMRGFGLVLSILLTALAVACTAKPIPQSAHLPNAVAHPQVQESTAPTARTVTSLAEIAGEWDIVTFDGHSPPRLDSDGRRHAYVDIGQQGLRFAISCNYSNMPGLIKAGALHPAPTGFSMQTEMGCGAEREARDETFFKFFRSRPQVNVLPDGSLRMVSPGHELLLERSALRRLATGPSLSEITGTWRVVGITQFVGGGYRGWGAMYAPGRVRIKDGTLSYSRCPAASVRFAYTRDFVLRRQDAGGPTASVECRGVSPAATEVEPMLAALLRQSPEAERLSGGRFILRSRNYGVVLTSQADYRREFGEQAADWERHPGTP